MELLEETLGQYAGTIILVSHDREFVDNLVDCSLFFEGNGNVVDFVGGYAAIEQWYTEREKRRTEHVKAEAKRVDTANEVEKPQKQNKKLSYKLQRELDTLPGKIETLEEEIENLQVEINSTDFFTQDSSITDSKLTLLSERQTELEVAYERWEYLDGQTN